MMLVVDLCDYEVLAVDFVVSGAEPAFYGL